MAVAVAVAAVVVVVVAVAVAAAAAAVVVAVDDGSGIGPTEQNRTEPDLRSMGTPSRRPKTALAGRRSLHAD